ncbi:MAG: dihydroneopterin aldolase [Candidatus Eremiobacteraeota bacterium]|nr:dihydroneopterin aldolase [Candidatus Eremiobacteraeota bacterium]
MDVISLRNIQVMARHGANPGERDAEQPFNLEVTLLLDLSAAEISDDLVDTVNYDAIYRRIVHAVRTTSFELLERLAGEVLSTIFEDTRIAHAAVTISKPGLLDGATPTVTIGRENPRFDR